MKFDIFGAYMSYTQRTAVQVLSCYTRKHIVEVRKVLGLRATSALGSYEITHVAEILTRVHEARRHRQEIFTQTRMQCSYYTPASLVPPTARRRRLSTVARSLPKPSFWYIPSIKSNLPSDT